MKYRKKPIEIEAFRPGFEETPQWARDAIKAKKLSMIYSIVRRDDGGLEKDQYLYSDILTLEGKMRAEHGDWILKGVQGELYPCKADIFEATYEPVMEIA